MKNTKSKIILKNLQITELEHEAHISGLLLVRKDANIHSESKTFSTFSKIIRSYFDQPVSNTPLRVVGENTEKWLETDEFGNFAGKIPADEIENIRLFDQKGELIGLSQEYPSVFPKNNARHLLISDIDDTILISKSARFFSKLRLMLLKKPQNRKPVVETLKAYQFLRDKPVNFAYVSGSESNLFDLLTTFIQMNDFPSGPVFLRPYMVWQRLLKPKKRKTYKLDRIERLIEFYPHANIILFGDDSQQDYDVFKKLASEYPEKITAVFLRRTGFTKRFNELAVATSLNDSDIQLYYYNAFEQIQDALNQLFK